MYVFTLNENKLPCNMVHPAVARKLLKQGKAKVYKRYPFTIIGDCFQTSTSTHKYRLGIDPGSKVTGLSIVDIINNRVCWAMELKHRGGQIKDKLDSRRANRRGRRNRKLRYRPARFNNRSSSRKSGRLAPSVMHRALTTYTWVSRLIKLAPISCINFEYVKFDTQLLDNPEISGVEYQQGELWGYEVKEYLLEKFKRCCVYCGVMNVPLQVEHIVPKSRGGTNRISNLTLSCNDCNKKKDNLTASEFGYPDIQKRCKTPLKDAAVMNSIRYATGDMIKKLEIPVNFSSGGLTKLNRVKNNLPKEHWIDAACVGDVGIVDISSVKSILHVKCMGHGCRQRVLTDKHGFPKAHKLRQKKNLGIQTGDIVMAYKPRKKSTVVGRISVNFQRPVGNLEGKTGNLEGVMLKYCKIIQKCDGYAYSLTPYSFCK